MKTLRYLFVTLVILIIGLGSYFWVMRQSIVTRFLTHHLASDVEVGSVKITFTSLILERVKIKNTKLTAVSNALEIDKIVIICFPLEYFHNVIHINRLSIQSPLVRLEYYDTLGEDNNWAKLLTQTTNRAKDKLFVVKNLEILNMKFWGTNAEGKQLNLWPLPYLEFFDVGTSKPVTLTDMTKLIFQTVIGRVAKGGYIPASTLSKVPPLSPELIEIKSTLASEDFQAPE